MSGFKVVWLVEGNRDPSMTMWMKSEELEE